MSTRFTVLRNAVFNFRNLDFRSALRDQFSRDTVLPKS